MKNKITTIATTAFFMCSGALMAQQELILDLGSNPVIKSEILKHGSGTSAMRSQSGGPGTLREDHARRRADIGRCAM